MGRRMAAHCVAKQELSVWNRSPKAAADFAATHGATQTDLPAELAAASDMVITMLADDQAARDVFLGTGGLIAADGADLLVEMGTMSPGLIREIAETATYHGKTFVDAPVSGSTQAAEDGSLLIMAGASDQLASRLSPIFDRIGRQTIWLGQSGAGAAMKLAVNALIHGLNQTLAEAMTLAESVGIDPDMAYDAIESSAAAAPMLKYRRSLYLDEASQDVSFTIALAQKDVRLALDLAGTTGIAMPQTQATLEVLQAASDADFGNRDMAAILSFMRDSNA